MALARNRDPVPQFFQVVDNALHTVVGHGVVGPSSTSNRIKPRVNIVPGWRTHGGSLKATFEAHSFARQLIDIGRVGLTSIAADIPKGQIIGHHKDQIGVARQKRGVQQEEQQQDFLHHFGGG